MEINQIKKIKNMKHFEVVTIGSALKDIMFYSSQIVATKNKKEDDFLSLPFGAKVPVEEVFVNYGGGAMNVVVGLNNFGIKASPMICLGKDAVGQEIFSHLKDQKIDTSLITVEKNKKTGFSIILTSEKDKEHSIFTYRGASADLSVGFLRDFRTDWFYVSSLANENWVFEFEKIVRQTKRGVKIAWNPGENQLKDYKKIVVFLKNIEILILNKNEAKEFVKNIFPRSSADNLHDVKFLLSKIHELGCQKVVITQGAKGAVAIDEYDDYFYVPAISNSEKIVDTVGAGDAFASGLLAAYIRFKDFEKALKIAIRNSTFVLYRIGAQNGLLKINL